MINYLNIWNGDFITNDKTEEPIYPKITAAKDKLYKLTMIELLHSLNIDLDVILLLITQILKKKKFKQKKNKI